MERLTAVDAAFLAVETPTNHMHVATLVLLDPSTAPGPWGLEAVRALVADRLHLVPPFRRRALEVPFGLAPPVWVEDPGFVLDQHLHRATLPAPGDDSQLLELVGRLVGLPLDRARPLWDLHVVDGLESGQVAVLVKVHHAAIDGLLGAALLVNLLDPQPESASVGPAAPPWVADDLPSGTDLLAGAVAWVSGRPAAALDAARRTLETAQAVRRSNEEAGGRPPPAPFSAPPTSLNVPVTSARRLARAEVSLDDVKAVKRAFGCTVNDVVLAMCAAALRGYLAGRGEQPDGDLVALVPVAARGDGDGTATMANLLSPMLVSLATTVDDPAARLRAVADGTRRAKAQERLIGGQVVRDWAEVAVPAVTAAAARLASGVRLAERVPPPFNVIVSNVPGPPIPLYLAGARVGALVPVGPVADGLALNVTVLSHVGRLFFGLLADPAAVPGVGEIAALLAPALEELVKAAAEDEDGVDGAPEPGSAAEPH